MSTADLLSVRNLHKKYGAVTALRNVSFTVRKGEVTALLGDNGAGKSTTIKAISGAAPADSGNIILEGQEVSLRRPADANALGIQTVYQDLALCDNLGICANLFLGRERVLWPFGILRDVDMEAEALRVLKTLRVNLPSLDTHVSSLSGGQRQAVAIARAVLWGTKLVIMDEPTAALGLRERAAVETLIGNLRREGIAQLIISHDLEQVMRISDSIWVMRGGRTIANWRTKDIDRTSVVGAIAGGTA